MSKHTPGPWISNRAGSNMSNNHSQPFAIAQEGKANIIAGVFGDVQGGEEIAAANARLIAAAPDLLAAMELALRKEPNETPGGFTKQWVIDARAAISKATGQQ